MTNTHAIGDFDQALVQLKRGKNARVIGSAYYYQMRSPTLSGQPLGLYQITNEGCDLGRVASIPTSEVLSMYWEVWA